MLSGRCTRWRLAPTALHLGKLERWTGIGGISQRPWYCMILLYIDSVLVLEWCIFTHKPQYWGGSANSSAHQKGPAYVGRKRQIDKSTTIKEENLTNWWCQHAKTHHAGWRRRGQSGRQEVNAKISRCSGVTPFVENHRPAQIWQKSL